MSAIFLIVNMSEKLDSNSFGDQCIIPNDARPKYVHFDLESAEKKLLGSTKNTPDLKAASSFSNPHRPPNGEAFLNSHIAASLRLLPTISPWHLSPPAPRKRRRGNHDYHRSL